jgi:hypothetical protein
VSEIDQLKSRVDEAGSEGVLTAHIRDEAGQMMINRLCDSEDYIQRKGFGNALDQQWRVFQSRFAPY